MEFITKEEFIKLIDAQSVDMLNEVLSRVFNKAVETALQMTPKLTAQLIKSSVGMRKITDKFLSDNPQFKGHETIVEQVVRQTELANPGFTYEQVLSTAVQRINEKISVVSSQMRLIN